MPVQIDIADSQLSGFTAEGKNVLKVEVENFPREIIRESGRIEATVMEIIIHHQK